jgi:hypothetical protein
VNRFDDWRVKVEPVRFGPWRGRLVRPEAGAELERLFGAREFPAPGFAGRAEVVASNIGRTYRLMLPGAGQPVWFAKDFTGPEAARTWRAVLTAREAGLPTPAPVALLWRRSWGLTRRSVVVTEAVPNARDQNLEYYFRNNFDLHPLPRPRVREKRVIIGLLGDLFRRVHAQDRIYFPDFHPHNLVLHQDGEGRPALALVDFDEVRFKVRPDDRMKNLASLERNADKINKRMRHPAITGRDRVRFLQAYLHTSDRETVRRLAERIRANRDLK